MTSMINLEVRCVSCGHSREFEVKKGVYDDLVVRVESYCEHCLKNDNEFVQMMIASRKDESDEVSKKECSDLACCFDSQDCQG